jgi:hypothetical protein
VVHATVVPFVLLLIITVLAALLGMTCAVWRSVRGPRRAIAAAWGLVCFLPMAFWIGESVFTLRLAATGRAFPKNVLSDVAAMASASAMEGEAQLAYPHRLESQRLVMFYDDRVTDPTHDLEAMDRHVAALEKLTGRLLRDKIHWVRGEVFGRRHMTIRGLALGSSKSPVDWETADHPWRLSVDRHELAHGVVHQLQPPDADPPTLLIEGWAEAHAGMTAQRRAELALHSRRLWRERGGGRAASSYLRELTSPSWYHRVDAAVYDVGGALAEFVLLKYGVDRFLRWYFACRPAQVEEACLAQLGVRFDALESAFWNEAERLVAGARPPGCAPEGVICSAFAF